MGVSVEKFYSYHSEDFETISKFDDPDVGIANKDMFDTIHNIIKKKTKTDKYFQRIDISIINNSTVVFIQDQISIDYFSIFEAHCSIKRFKKLLSKL